ncbi:uncharacterized protein LOC126632193 isoform X2 [Malus sylvestris]|uniref:uncharacterized protein LOC126632193 isoform X2 n=1 Tax=Malus sylvestris TaxID=3752 RepID=UPI0021AC5BB0|nr:uncharacterized protein LOC126632193 isoform X2 [Malus sylvestris]
MRWWWVPDTVPLALFFTATSCQKTFTERDASILFPGTANIEFYLIGEKVQQISTGSIKRMIKLLRFLTYRMKAAAREFEPWPVEIRFCKEASLLESGLIESRQLQGNLSFGMYRYDFATKLVRKKALKLLLLQPISTIYQALVEAPGKHIHYIANLEKPWYIVVLKVFLIMLLCPVGRVYMTYSELRDTDRLIHP